MTLAQQVEVLRAENDGLERAQAVAGCRSRRGGVAVALGVSEDTVKRRNDAGDQAVPYFADGEGAGMFAALLAPAASPRRAQPARLSAPSRRWTRWRLR